MRIGEVEWSDDGAVSCARCSARICSHEENWKEHSLVKRGNAAERLNGGEFGSTYAVYEHEDLELAEIFCPHCSALLSVELYVRDEPFRNTYRSLEDGRADGYDPVAEYRAEPERWISFAPGSEEA